MRCCFAFLPILLACGCSAPGAEERQGEAQAPIIGGIDDVFRSYVVGVGAPYDPSNPGDPSAGPFCSGTLVSKRTVITAGHCFTPGMGPTGGITAVFFGPDITYPLPSSATMVATVQAVLHPGFDPKTLTNDLTMVQLAKDAPSQAVPLLRETMANTPEFVGPPLSFAGYGNDGNQDYGIRRVAVFPIAAVGPACVGLDTGTGPIDATELYYRVANKNTCDGDSGGPAFLPVDAVERLAGATSAGDPSCTKDGDDARTDQPQIEAFIQPTIDLFEAMDPCRADGVCNESCNTGGQLVDPDCAPYHCAADGICVLSCVDPPDPDCPKVDHCPLDGVCDPTCSPADPDCQPPPDAGPPDLGGTDGGACGGGSTTKGSVGSAASTGTAGSHPDAGAGSEDDDGDDAFDCAGCAVPGRRGGQGAPWSLVLGAIWVLARSRSRSRSRSGSRFPRE